MYNSLNEKTLEYWRMQRQARGLPPAEGFGCVRPTVQDVLHITGKVLKELNPIRPLARQMDKLRCEAIEGGRSKKAKTAATVVPFPTHIKAKRAMQ